MVERLKRSNSPKWFFSQNTTNKIFVYLLAPFILQNFEKILRVNPELCHFRAQNGPFVISKFFWYKPLLLSSTYWPFSLCKILKILTADPELWGWAIFGPKMVHLPQTILCHFWPLWVIFPQWGFFQKLRFCHTELYMAPNTMLSLRTDGRTDGQTEGQMDGPYFIGPFRLRPGVQ